MLHACRWAAAAAGRPLGGLSLWAVCGGSRCVVPVPSGVCQQRRAASRGAAAGQRRPQLRRMGDPGRKGRDHLSQEYRFERVVFLGTSSATPAPGKRNMSSLCVAGNNGSVIMVDCGEGTQHQLKVATALRSSKVDMILITHLHGDHCYGLFGLLFALAEARGVAHAEERPPPEDDADVVPAGHPLILVGPEGLRSMVEAVLQASGGWGDAFHIRFVEIPNAAHEAKATVDLMDAILMRGDWGTAAGPPSRPAAQGDGRPPGSGVRHTILHRLPNARDPEACTSAAHLQAAEAECRASAAALFGELQIKAVPLVHRLTCWGYVVEEPGRAGKLDVRRARALGVPAGPLLGDLKSGKSVTVQIDGAARTVHPSECVGDRTPGRKVCVLQDSCDSQYALDACRGADLFIHECTFEKAMKEDALRKGHSTTHMAAEWAMECEAKALVLTHFSARYTESSAAISEARAGQGGEGVGISPTDPTEVILGPEAREVFTRGDVVVAHDFMVLDGNVPAGFKVRDTLCMKRNPWLR